MTGGHEPPAAAKVRIRQDQPAARECSGAWAAGQDADAGMAMPPPAYAELHCLSDFTFLRGASSAAQLFERARACGYQALAITDECSLAGIVRAFEASRNTGVPLIVGSEFRLVDGTRFVLLVQDQVGYEALCSLITAGRRAAGKGCYRLTREDFTRPGLDLSGLLCLWLPSPHPDEVQADAPDQQQTDVLDGLDGLGAKGMGDEAPALLESGGDRHALERAAWVRRTFPHAWLAVELHRDRDDAAVLRHLLALAQRTGLTPVACGDVHMDLKRRRALQDTLTALRHRRPLTEAGGWLFRNGERHLRRREVLAGIYPPALLAEAVHLQTGQPAVPLSAGAGAGGTHPHLMAAPSGRGRAALALAAGGARTGRRAGRA